jgi:hypothetical protein
MIRPTALDVINAFHGHLAATGRHRTTSNELALAKGWYLMDVSAALNQANAHGSLIREGGTFRPGVSQIGRSIDGRQSALIAKPSKPAPVEGKWPPDAEFARRYELALSSPLGPSAGLVAEFGRTYNGINYHATEVYRRLGKPKPSARGRLSAAAVAAMSQGSPCKTQFPDDAEFCQRYEQSLKAGKKVRQALEAEFGATYTTVNKHAGEVYARLGQPKPSARNWVTPAPESRIPTAAPEEFFAEAPQQPVEPSQATEHTDVPEQVSVASGEAQGGNGEGLAEESNEYARRKGDAYFQRSDLTPKEAENTRLRDMMSYLNTENQEQHNRQRANEKLIADLQRQIAEVNERMMQTEIKPQQITLTLTLPMDAIQLAR